MSPGANPFSVFTVKNKPDCIKSALARVRKLGAQDIEKHYAKRVLVSFSFTLRNFRVACLQSEGKPIFRQDITEKCLAMIQNAGK